MSKHDVQCLWEVGAQLGEGPLWMAEQNRLYFVDLKKQTCTRWKPAASAAAGPCRTICAG
jgi:sugar lactone lactonase YvrE